MTLPAPGSYGVVATHGFYPWLIRIGTHSRYNHAFLVVDDQGGIIEADPGGARRSTITAYAGNPILYSNDPMTLSQRNAAITKATVLLGTGYGWLDITRLSLRSLGLQWNWLTTAADNEKAMICSQLVAACGQAAGLDWNCGRENPAAVTPGDLANRITG